MTPPSVGFHVAPFSSMNIALPPPPLTPSDQVNAQESLCPVGTQPFKNMGGLTKALHRLLPPQQLQRVKGKLQPSHESKLVHGILRYIKARNQNEGQVLGLIRGLQDGSAPLILGYPDDFRVDLKEAICRVPTKNPDRLLKATHLMLILNEPIVTEPKSKGDS